MAKAEREQLRERTYRAIRLAILEGKYLPGQHLVEQAVADDLQLSKTPVREALAKLEEEGVVESFPYRGFFVKSFSAKDIAEIYELRELYEGACARAAAGSAEHEDIADQLERGNEAAREAFEQGDLDVVHERFGGLDEILFGATRNEQLREQIKRIRIQIHLGGILTNQIPGRIEKSLGQHEVIIEAVRKGDAELAEDVTRMHVRSLLEDELERRERRSAGAASL